MEKDFHIYANFSQRLLAFLIDFLVLFVATSIVWLIFQLPIPDRHTDLFGALVLFANPFGSIFSWLYYAIMESSKLQGTFGKMAIGIKVVNMNGERISFMNATGRFFGKFISSLLLCFGYFMIIFTKKHQALHDIMASTFLIKKTKTNVEHNSVSRSISEYSPLKDDGLLDFMKDHAKVKESFPPGVFNNAEFEKNHKILEENEVNPKIDFQKLQEINQDFSIESLAKENVNDNQEEVGSFKNELTFKQKKILLDELKTTGVLSESEFNEKLNAIVDAEINLHKKLENKQVEELIDKKVAPILEKLHELYKAGILTLAELSAKKEQVYAESTKIIYDEMRTIQVGRIASNVKKGNIGLDYYAFLYKTTNHFLTGKAFYYHIRFADGKSGEYVHNIGLNHFSIKQHTGISTTYNDELECIKVLYSILNH
jgi:uncharacterized RDD family membrane protein YckC